MCRRLSYLPRPQEHRGMNTQLDPLLASWLAFVVHQTHGRDAVPFAEVRSWVDALLFASAPLFTSEEMDRVHPTAALLLDPLPPDPLPLNKHDRRSTSAVDHVLGNLLSRPGREANAAAGQPCSGTLRHSAGSRCVSRDPALLRHVLERAFPSA